MAETWKRWEGQVVNDEFPLLRYLGGSEHSAVFLSKRTDREPQEVAIKLIPAKSENPELQLSWWELAAKLSHPHLLRIFQLGRCELDGTEFLYVVTEYAEESLAQILPYRTLTPEEARETLQPLLDALAYIHAKGFVHGHLKPANIMAVGDQIKVSADRLCGAGESSRVLGAPSIYAAPEMLNGGGVSPASDVWSLGMTLVEALTQSPPVAGRSGQTELVLPETLPEPFFDIASHSLRRNPQQRWTVADIAARLQQTRPVLDEERVAHPKSSFSRWGYVIPVLAVGLLLAVLGPRLFHRGSEPNPSSSVESSAGQQAAGTGPASSASVASSSSSAATDATKNATANNSTGGTVHGTVAHQVLPDVQHNAYKTVHGKLKVRIKVTVDSSGKVVVGKFDSRGPSRYFADRALRAAQEWTFNPPQVGGQPVPSEWNLRFEFTRNGASVYSEQTYPR